MHHLRTLAFALAAAILVVHLAACEDDDDVPEGPGDIIDVATDAGDFNTLLTALDAAGLTDDLRQPGPFTLFAPTDAAFDLLPAGTIDALLDDVPTLTSILTYHVLEGEVPASGVVGTAQLATMQGENLRIAAPADETPDGASVILNGLVQVTTVDIEADNGVIHVVDAVLIPGTMEYPGTLADAVAGHPILSALEEAVTSVDLTDALDAPFAAGRTLFAPQDAAFAEIGGLLSGISVDELTDILLYHVVEGTVFAATLANMDSATTLNGADISVDDTGGIITLNDDQADVVYGDLETSNGILHVLNGALVPPG